MNNPMSIAWFSSIPTVAVGVGVFGSEIPEAITLALWGITLLVGAAALRSRARAGRLTETNNPAHPRSATEIRGSAHAANI